MLNRGKTTVAFWLGALLAVSCCAQVVKAVGYGGKLYALGFFNLTSGDPATFGPISPVFEEILISCFQCTTQVIIRVPSLNYRNVVSLNSTNGHSARIQLNQDIATAIQFPTGLTWTNAAVTVAALNSTINVHVNKARPGSNAAYLAYPIRNGINFQSNPQNSIYNYFAASYTSVGNSILSVMSVYNNTCVQILKNFSIYQDISLQENEAFNMYANAGTSDFTGVQVTSRKPIAVFSGLDNAQIPSGVSSYDAIMEQVPAFNYLRQQSGPVYHILTSVPGLPYEVGFEYRIIGATTSTSISNITIHEYSYVSPGSAPGSPVITSIITLNRGDFVNRTAGRGDSKFTVVVVTCPTSCMVAQYVQGNAISSVGSTNLHPDPAMVVVSPVHAYTRDISFSTSLVSDGTNAIPARNFITIVADSTSYQSLQLDGSPLGSTWYTVGQPSALSGKYFISNVPVTHGFHTLTATSQTPSSTYNAFVFGYGTDSSLPTAYAYMAAIENPPAPFTDSDPPAGPWYSLPIANSPIRTPADNATGRLPVASELRPSYGVVVLANFTALSPYAVGKVADRICAITYANYFIYRIQNLVNDTANDRPWARLYAANPACSSSGIVVTITVRNTSDDVYYNEYSRTAGFFTVNITGSENATLGNVYLCATSLSRWIQNPNNWINGYNSNSTNFLRKDNVDFVGYQTLKDSNCAWLYLSNNNGLLSIYTKGWVCPLTSTSVFSRANFSSKFATTTQIVAVLFTALIAFLFR